MWWGYFRALLDSWQVWPSDSFLLVSPPVHSAPTFQVSKQTLGSRTLRVLQDLEFTEDWPPQGAIAVPCRPTPPTRTETSRDMRASRAELMRKEVVRACVSSREDGVSSG